MPHRPFTRVQALQNAAFLRVLATTGNARLAAAQLGVHRSTYTKRRALDPPLPLAGGGRGRACSAQEPNNPRATGGEPIPVPTTA